MKRKMKDTAKKVLAAILSVSIALGGLSLPLKTEAQTTLVNVAPDAEASTEDGSYGDHVIANVNDNDPKTSWQTEGKWPSTAILKLDQGRNVSKISIELGEDGDNSSGRTALVTVKYAQNGITSDLNEFSSKRMTVDSKEDFTVEIPVSATHIYVSLSDPQNADGSQVTFWPSVQEIEVFEEQEEKLSNYNNIAAQAEVTTDGTDNAADGPKSNLTDGNDGTLYKYHNAAQSSEKYVLLTFNEARKMDAFRIAFEHIGDTDGIGFAFEYSILAKNADDASYTTIADHQRANRTDNWQQQYKFAEASYSEVKIVMHSCTTNSGNGWPAIAEFEVYGSEKEIDDSDSAAFRKPVHVPFNRNNASYITDGNPKTSWSGDYYPAYADIDLGENYYLDEIEVYTPSNGYSQYSIYTSMDGKDFDKLAEKTSTESCPETGEVYQANKKEARIVRIYLEYNSASTKAVLNEVRVKGTKSNTPVQTRPEIEISDNSAYDFGTITKEDTLEEVRGIIRRRLGDQYVGWFNLQLADNPKAGHDYDYFQLSTTTSGNQTIVNITGNDGVSLATGLNHYLKYFCKVNLSQVGDQAKMPAEPVKITDTVFKETKARVRYSYNYCTLSYSMAFYGKKEWRDELDWLALNGVNVVLDATAQEEVWRRFLTELGYSHEDTKDFIAGPAYYAWAYMANLSGFGGPVHDSWFTERTELARENQLIMRKLGMQPVLQGYSGMVPTDILDHAAEGAYALTANDIIEQGKWCDFTRPTMLKTTSAAFDKYAELFYKCQKEVYGDVSDYYATDPFHEGGITDGMNPADISEKVLNAMMKADKDAVWIIQSWQGNPSTALLNGLDRVENGAQHALILDLYAEKDPHYDEGSAGNGAYGDEPEFDATPWVFCMLNNFGGRLGLHGHLDNLANNIPEVFNQSSHIAGIGITPEASVNNPVLYDFLFETIWQDDAETEMKVIDLDTWLDDYAERRYGAASENANQAWDILKETVYKASLNNRGQGAPESVVNARPNLDIGAASTWGNAVIGYEKGDLEDAAALLLEDYDKLKDSEGYQYDLANVLQQVLSNSAQEYQKKMTAAFRANNADDFKTNSDKFLAIIDCMEKVTGTSEYFLLGRWVEQAKALAGNADDFTKDLYEFNAKALVTTWGSKNQAETGGLKDYSNRQWSGLINDFYKERWQRWITARTNELAGTDFENNINWFEWEWAWARGNKEYPAAAVPQDLQALGNEILENYSVKNPAANDEFDLPLDGMTATAGSAQPNDPPAEGPAANVLDNNADSIWHSKWAGDDRNNLWIDIALGESKTVNGIRVLPRKGSANGIITQYCIKVSNDNGTTYTEVATGTWAGDTSWKWAKFDDTEATNVRLYAVNSVSDNQNKNFASAAEIRIMGPKSAAEETVTIEVNAEHGTVTGGGKVTKGASVTLTAAPETGYRFVSWTDENGKVLGTETTYTFTAEKDCTITANFDQISHKLTVTAPEAEGSITVEPLKDAYADDDEITVTAAANRGYEFVKLTVNGQDIEGTSYKFRIKEDTQITAVFKESTRYAVTADTEDPAKGTVTVTPVEPAEDGDGKGYLTGDQITLHATPASSDYNFVNWTEDGKVVSTDPSFTLTIEDSARHLTAHFEEAIKNYYVDFEYDKTMGSVSVDKEATDGHYEENTELTLTATPNKGYKFVSWSEASDTEILSAENPYTFKVTRNITLVATFAEESIPDPTYQVSVNVNDENMGTALIDPQKDSYLADETVTVTAEAIDGYEFVSWTVNKEIVSTSAQYGFKVKGDTALTANFKAKEKTAADVLYKIEANVPTSVDKGEKNWKLPELPDGFKYEISSSDPSIIDNNGKVTAPEKDTTVNVTIRIVRESDNSVSDKVTYAVRVAGTKTTDSGNQGGSNDNNNNSGNSGNNNGSGGTSTTPPVNGSNNAQTGDSAQTILWTALMLAAIAAIVLFRKKYRA